MKIAAIQCPKCLNIIFSRARHDFHACSCGESMIDGGRDYTKVGYRSILPYSLTIEFPDKYVDELYRDWNRGTDKFGVIKTRKVAYDMLYRYTLNEKGKFYRYQKK